MFNIFHENSRFSKSILLLVRNPPIVTKRMSMKSTIEVQDQVIFRRFSGEVCIDDMLQSWKEIFADYEDLGAYRGIVTSFLEADIKHDDNNFNVMVEFLKDYVDRITGMKVAIVMDTPMVTSTIIMNQKMKNMHIRPFTTMDAALEWIDA